MAPRRDRHPLPGTSRHGQQGFVLVAVLWLAALLSIMAMGQAGVARMGARRAGNELLLVQQQLSMVSALDRGWHEYRKYTANRRLLAAKDEIEGASGRTLDLWYPRYEPYRVELPSGEGAGDSGARATRPWGVSLRSTAGRFNVNTISRDLLVRVAQACGAEPEQAETVADSVLDWIDSDDNHRLEGAENQYYEGLEQPYLCKNGPIESVAELLLVRGVTPELYWGDQPPDEEADGAADPDAEAPARAAGRAPDDPAQALLEHGPGRPGLVDFLTVGGQSQQLDVNSVSPRAFAILEGFPDEAVQAIVQLRSDAPIKDLDELLDVVPQRHFDAFSELFGVLTPEYLEIGAAPLGPDVLEYRPVCVQVLPLNTES